MSKASKPNVSSTDDSKGLNRVGIAMTQSQNNREDVKHGFSTSSGSSMETLIISVPPPPRLVELLNQWYDLPKNLTDS